MAEHSLSECPYVSPAAEHLAPFWCGSSHMRAAVQPARRVPSGTPRPSSGTWMVVLHSQAGRRQLLPLELLPGRLQGALAPPSCCTPLLPVTVRPRSHWKQQPLSSNNEHFLTGNLLSCFWVSMLPGALQNRFPVQPVVRLVADTTAHSVARGEAPVCGLARLWQMCLASPGLPFHSEGPFPHLPAAAISQLIWTRHDGKCCRRHWSSVWKSCRRLLLWERWSHLWWDSPLLTFCCQNLIWAV